MYCILIPWWWLVCNIPPACSDCLQVWYCTVQWEIVCRSSTPTYYAVVCILHTMFYMLAKFSSSIVCRFKNSFSLAWILLFYEMIITVSCWHNLFEIIFFYFFHVMQTCNAKIHVYLQMKRRWQNNCEKRSKCKNDCIFLHFPICHNFFCCCCLGILILHRKNWTWIGTEESRYIQSTWEWPALLTGSLLHN